MEKVEENNEIEENVLEDGDDIQDEVIEETKEGKEENSSNILLI